MDLRRRAQAVLGEVDTLADAHAGRAKQEEHISARMVAAHELLLEEIDPARAWTGTRCRAPRSLHNPEQPRSRNQSGSAPLDRISSISDCQ
jgi:hypothetical protein